MQINILGMKFKSLKINGIFAAVSAEPVFSTANKAGH